MKSTMNNFARFAAAIAALGMVLVLAVTAVPATAQDALICRKRDKQGDKSGGITRLQGKKGQFYNAGDGNDKLYGTPGDDILNGGRGHDKVYGMGGNDVVCGGLNNDKVYGGNGNDSSTARSRTTSSTAAPATTT